MTDPVSDPNAVVPAVRELETIVAERTSGLAASAVSLRAQSEALGKENEDRRRAEEEARRAAEQTARSNRALEEWYPLFLDDLIASAAMDRLLHHAHVVVMEGNSFRNPPGSRKVA